MSRPSSARPLSVEDRRRIELTVAAPDTEDIPKVDGSGTTALREGVEVQVMHTGVVVERGGYHGEWMAEIIERLRGHHEPQEERAFHEIVERLRRDGVEDAVMIELGAFWSYYTLWFQGAFPGGRNVILEPDPANLALAKRNLALNGMSADAVQAAVGLPHGGTTILECESDGVERELPLMSIDGLVERFGLPRVDLVLADVQGAELDALRGAAKTASRGGLRFLVVSTHHHAISGDPLIHRRCLDLLAEWDAHILVEHTVEESASGDGLIVASLDPADRDMRIEVSRVRASDSLFGGLEADLARALDAAERERSAAAELRARVDGLAARAASNAANPALPGELAASRSRVTELEAELRRVRDDRDELHAELHRVRQDRDRLQQRGAAGVPATLAAVRRRVRRWRARSGR